MATPRSIVAAIVRTPAAPEPPVARPTQLDRGLRDIQRTDRASMRTGSPASGDDVPRRGEARVAREAGGLRDRLTPEMHAELLVFCEGLRTSGDRSGSTTWT